MTRFLCGLAVLGVAAAADRAAGYHPCWAPPPPCGPVYGYVVPVYPAYPLPAYPAPVAAVPARRAPLAPPRIAPVDPPAAAATPKPAPPPTIEPAPTPLAAPSPAPPPASAPETVRPAGGAVPPVFPDVPSSDAAPPARPPAPRTPATDLLPPVGVPVAPPSAEPAKKGEALPPLVLPPDVPGGPTGVVPGSTSRSSPVGGPAVEVLTVAGAPKLAATRKVGFFNHTGKAIELVIDGKAVTLPRKSYLHAEVPPAFRWRYNGQPAEAATVPDDAAGLDVVFRE